MVIKKQKKKNKQVNECRSVIKYKFSCVKGIWKVICDKVIKAGAWLLSCCQRKIWLCNEMKSQFSSFAVSTSSWLLGLRESRYFLVLNSHLAHTFSHFSHIFSTSISLSHPLLRILFPSIFSVSPSSDRLSGGCQRPEVADTGNIPAIRGGLHHRPSPQRQEEEVRHQVEE